MANQVINIGNSGNDGTGDGIRQAFEKVNFNFSEVYAGINAPTYPLVPGDGLETLDASGTLIASYNSKIQQATIKLSSTGITPGKYFHPNIIVDTYGRVIAVTSELSYDVAENNWIPVPSSYRLGLTGSGSMYISTRNIHDVIKQDAFIYTLSNVVDEIHSYTAEDTIFIRFMINGTISVKLYY